MSAKSTAREKFETGCVDRKTVEQTVEQKETLKVRVSREAWINPQGRMMLSLDLPDGSRAILAGAVARQERPSRIESQGHNGRDAGRLRAG